MKTKIALTINGTSKIFEPNELKNWQDVMCSLKRSEFGGVVRSFTSKFEFTGSLYRLLLDLYLADGIESLCDLSIYAMRDDWTFDEIFTCPLDFSTAQFDGYVFSVSAVDNSIAALIKSAKGTKYEMLVGEDIKPDGSFRFDRIPMTESATYEFTQGDSHDNGALTVSMQAGELPWLGCVGDEISVGGSILYKDDQDVSAGGCLLIANKATDVTLKWRINIDRRSSSGLPFPLYVQVKGADSVKTDQRLGEFLLGGSPLYEFVGSFSSASDLPDAGTDPNNTKNWALVNNIVWLTRYKGWGCEWESLGLTEDEWAGSETHEGSMTLSMDEGDRLSIVGSPSQGTSVFKLNSSSFELSWLALGEMCDIPAFTPRTVCEAILKKIIGDKYNVSVDFSDFDSRIANTRLMAAESIRDLPSAKLYSSFSEFASWMETVFGYVYCIGESHKRYTRIVEVGQIIGTGYSFEASMYQGDVDPANIVYIQPHGMFFYHEPTTGKYYISFEGYSDYTDNFSRPLQGVVYRFAQGLYYFIDGDNTPHRYEYDTSLPDGDLVIVHFQHRSEMFNGTIGKTVDDVKSLSYKIDRAQIFSTVEVGYEKKDYDNINGRDEFNFTHVYNTGTSVSEKKLSLVSKYRADSYGIEFAAQKRGAKTSDTSSDQSVFFVHCTVAGRMFYPDRSAALAGTLTPYVFNAVFNPMACALANTGYIGMQSAGMCLTFASATGNSSVIVNGEPINADLELGEQLLTIGSVEFDTDDQAMPEDANSAVKVLYKGMEIVGYISDLDIKAMRPEPAKYKLIVKTITSL